MLDVKTSSATARSTLHNIFYILRQRLHEAGMEFESRGSDVVDRVPG